MIGHGVPLLILLPVLAVVGAYIGRFLYRCSRRFPEHESLREQLTSLAKPLALCAGCDCQPTAKESLPIIGWILSGRRCRECRRLLSAERPLIEFVTACLFVVIYLL